MFSPIRIPAVFFAILVATESARANWITIRNDTKQELIIQEVVMVNGKPKLGKGIKLLPGESLKENKAAAGSKSIVVSDATKPNTVIARGTLEWKKDDLTFTIKSDAMGTTITPVK